MAQTKEKHLWQWLRQAKFIIGADLFLGRVENNVTAGNPDVDCCFSGLAFGIELKSVARPKRETTKIKIRLEKSQLWYHQTKTRAGGIIYNLIQVGSGAEARRYLVHCKHNDLLVLGLTENSLASIAIVDPLSKPVEIFMAIKDNRNG